MLSEGLRTGETLCPWGHSWQRQRKPEQGCHWAPSMCRVLQQHWLIIDSCHYRRQLLTISVDQWKKWGKKRIRSVRNEILKLLTLKAELSIFKQFSFCKISTPTEAISLENQNSSPHHSHHFHSKLAKQTRVIKTYRLKNPYRHLCLASSSIWIENPPLKQEHLNS